MQSPEIRSREQYAGTFFRRQPSFQQSCIGLARRSSTTRWRSRYANLWKELRSHVAKQASRCVKNKTGCGWHAVTPKNPTVRLRRAYAGNLIAQISSRIGSRNLLCRTVDRSLPENSQAFSQLQLAFLFSTAHPYPIRAFPGQLSTDTLNRLTFQGWLLLGPPPSASRKTVCRKQDPASTVIFKRSSPTDFSMGLPVDAGLSSDYHFFSAFGLASLTLIGRPSNSNLSSFAMASVASSCVDISTKANPFERLVSRSITM